MATITIKLDGEPLLHKNRGADVVVLEDIGHINKLFAELGGFWLIANDRPRGGEERRTWIPAARAEITVVLDEAPEDVDLATGINF